MAVNQGKRGKSNDDSNWNQSEDGGAGERQIQSGLGGLFQLMSFSADNRNLFELNEVHKQLEELYKAADGSTTPTIQRRMIPKVNYLTPAISSVLPGLVMNCLVEDTMWVMAVLFSTKEMTNASEPVRFNHGGQNTNLSVPIPPVGYINAEVMDNLRGHFERQGESEGFKNVALINMLLIDLEMLNHPEAGDVKDRPKRLAAYIANQWETAFLTKAAVLLANAGEGELPSPFSNPKKPYGKDNCAEARINSIQERVTKGLTLSAANMEVVASTANSAQNYNNNSSTANSKEIARATAIVSLSGLPYEQHMRNLQILQQSPNRDINAMMGMTGGIYQNGYKPLHPVITLESALAGEMMNYNQGLMPFFYCLYLLMATNTNYLFTEVLRRLSVGQRGNLIGLEGRIDSLLGGVPVPNRAMMTEKTINDIDFTNNWIRQNVSPHATFRSNLVTNGNDSAVNNFLTGLSSENREKEVKTTISVLSALSSGKFAKLVQRNIDQKSGWTPDKKVLHRTPMFVINGLAAMPVTRKKLNTQEVDEMFLFNAKGKNVAEILNFLNTQYGATDNDPRARCQRLRMEMEQTIFDGDMHVNSFAQSCVWDPGFMAVVAEALDGIGTMTVANSQAVLRPSQGVFMPGGGLATMTHAGAGNIYAGGPVGGYTQTFG